MGKYEVAVPVSKKVNGKAVRLMPRYEVEAVNLMQAVIRAKRKAVADGYKPLPYRTEIFYKGEA